MFRGIPGQDRLADGETPNVDQFECGRVTSNDTLLDIDEGTLMFEVRCVGVSGEFTVPPRRYIAAREEPYSMEISVETEKSVLGKTLLAPTAADCPDW